MSSNGHPLGSDWSDTGIRDGTGHLYGHPTAQPLDKQTRADIRKQLPDGYQLVEGDFAADEKWRIVAPEPAPPHPDTVPTPLMDYVAPTVIAECGCGCGENILSDEATVTDHRGTWKHDHYELPKDTAAETRKAHDHLRKMYDNDAGRLAELGLTLRRRT